MSAVEEVIDAPLDREQLTKRWQALCADPSFEDLAAKIELTEWGEIYGPEGRRGTSSFSVDLATLFR
jgi:hypothetical protein